MKDMGVMEIFGPEVSATTSWNRHGGERQQRRKVAVQSATAVQG